MTRLRIGIDGFNLALPNGTGVATYGLTLARTLHARGHAVEGVFGIDVGADPALREVLFFDRVVAAPPDPKSAAAVAARWRVKVRALRRSLTLIPEEVPLTPAVDQRALDDRLPVFDRLLSSPDLFAVAHRHFRYHRRFVRLRMADPPPIMHWTYPIPVELAGARNIYTIHDLVPLRLPYTTRDNKRFYHDLVRQCAARAARICTVSEASGRDIATLLGTDPSRISVTYQSAPDPPAAAAPEADAAAIAAFFGLRPQNYFLFFGTAEPKKNLARLIEAYLSVATLVPLVLVTGRSWRTMDELALLRDHADQVVDGRGARSGRIVLLDHMPRALLIRLIRSARAVLFPSIAEGFGLPVLEAMLLGTPVLTSNEGALSEVAGDAALLVDPFSVPAISAGIARLDADGALRRRLIAAGTARAAAFSPLAYAQRLEAMYASVFAEAH